MTMEEVKEMNEIIIYDSDCSEVESGILGIATVNCSTERVKKIFADTKAELEGEWDVEDLITALDSRNLLVWWKSADVIGV